MLVHCTAENEREFNNKQKLKLNVKKSKVMGFEREKCDGIEFGYPYRVRTEHEKQCEIKMNGRIMEEVYEYKYLGLILCKCGSKEGEVREKALQGRKVVGSLGHMTKGMTVNMDIKKALHDSIIVPTLSYVSERWTWNEGQRSGIQAIEMSYLGVVCGLNRMES